MKVNCIYNEDCSERIVEVCASVRNPVIVTDPPFNVGYNYDEYDDNRKEDDYYNWLGGILHNCPSVVIHYPEPLYRIAFQLSQVPARVVSWCYNSNTPKQHRDIAYFGIEPDFHGLGEYKNPTDKRVAELIKQGKKPIGYDWIYCEQVKNVSADKLGHPCQMPLAVMCYIINSLPIDATIIEPFAGSGTTCLAAKRGGRDFVGFEISKRYHKIATMRLLNDSPLFEHGVMI
jgi:hypothetical protein